MIILLTGASHTGKTALAQKLLEKYKYPYLSIDHLKMGLIRSGHTELTPMSEIDELTNYLWPIVREMIKTAIENEQNLIVEGCYIPFDWKKDFETEYLKHIEYYCFVMSENYIRNHYDDIKKFANVIEKRLDDDCTMEDMLEDNKQVLEMAKMHDVDYIFIHDKYEVEKGIIRNQHEIELNLQDEEWPFTYIDHDREIVRAIVFDNEGYFYFVRAERDDDFGKATLIETSGGGVEKGEDLHSAIKRELKEELGADVKILCKIGVVSDYYNLIHRHNINNYYLCKAISFGEKNLMLDEIEEFHLSTLKLTYEQAVEEYERCSCTRIGRLVANRELPILRQAKKMLDGEI